MAEVTGLRNVALPYPARALPWGVVFPILDADGDFVSGATDLDSEVSKNGDSFTDCTNESTEIGSSGMYYLLLTPSEMDADVVTVVVKTSTSGAKTTPMVLHTRKAVTVRVGTAAGGSTNYVTLDSGASAVDDFYTGYMINVDIDGVQETRIIDAYTGSTKQASVWPYFIGTPDSDDIFYIMLPEGVQLPRANVTHFGGVDGTFSSGIPAVNTTLIEGSDATNQIRDAVVDDATRIDASALNTATGTTIPAILDDTDLIDDGTSGLAKIATDVAAILVDTSTTLQGELDGIQADTEDIQSRIGTPSNLGGGATISANLSDIEAQTDDIGAAGAGLTALATAAELAKVPKSDSTVTWNATALASIQAEANDALVANHLDHLLAVTYDPASKPGAADALLNELVESDGGVARYTANALEEAPTGGSAPTAAEIVDEWEAQSQADPTGFHVNVKEVNGTAQTANDIGADVDAILVDTAEIGAAGAGLTNINLPNQTMDIVGNITGNLSGSVGSVTAGVSLADDAITASKFDESTAFPVKSNDAGSTQIARVGADGDTLETLSDQLDAKSSQSSVDDIPTTAELTAALAAADDAVLAAIAALNNLSAAQVNAQVVDALAVDTYAEPAAVPAATATLAAKLNWLAVLARNTVQQTATEQTLMADDGTTPIATAPVSDDTVTFERSEWT